MNTQSSAEIAEATETPSSMVPVSSFLQPNLSSALEERGYSECGTHAQEQVLALMSWEDRLIAGEEAESFASGMVLAFVSELIEPHDKGHTILAMLPEKLGELKPELEKAGIKMFEVASEQSESIPEDHPLIVGEVTALTEFFRSDVGRATSIGRVVVLDSGKLEISESKELLSEACKRGRRPQLVLVENDVNEHVKDLSKSYLRSTAQEETHYFVEVEAEGKSRLQTLIDTLETESLYPAVVFCKHTSEANSVESAISKAGISTMKLTGRVAHTKIRQVANSLASGEVSVLVATDSPSEHLELEKFALIVNFSIPSEPEVYIHRTESPLGTLADRKIVSIITQLDRSNFDYIRKIVSAKFEQSSGPDLQIVLERQAAKLKNAAVQQADKSDGRIMALAEILSADAKSKEIIAHLMQQVETLTALKEQSRGKRNQRDRKNNDERESDRSDDNRKGKQSRNNRDNRREEREEVQYVVRKTARIYIGHGTEHGLSIDKLKDITIEAEGGEKHSIVNSSIRSTYSFVDIEEGLGEKLIAHLKENPPIKVDDFCVNKAITISTKERKQSEDESANKEN